MILVTGATGTVGRELVRLLLESGQRVRVFVRDTKKAVGLFGSNPSLEISQGDMAIPETIDHALKGIDRVFLSSVADTRQVELQGNVISSAGAAHVKFIVKLSSMGTSEDSPVSLCRMHRLTEMQLEKSGIVHTHLHPHYFMQNLFDFSREIVRQKTLQAPMRNGKISLVDARDVAAVAHHLLTRGGFENRTCVITGPESLSFSQLAERISMVTGRPLRYVDIPPAAFQKKLKAAGTPEWRINDALKSFEIFAGGYSSAVFNTVEEITGKKARSFEQFVKDHADRFQSRGFLSILLNLFK